MLTKAVPKPATAPDWAAVVVARQNENRKPNTLNRALTTARMGQTPSDHRATQTSLPMKKSMNSKPEPFWVGHLLLGGLSSLVSLAEPGVETCRTPSFSYFSDWA